MVAMERESTSIRLLSGDDALLVFPAGLVSRKQSEGIKGLSWKKSFISKAKKYKKTIIPVYIDGRISQASFTTLPEFEKWQE